MTNINPTNGSASPIQPAGVSGTPPTTPISSLQNIVSPLISPPTTPTIPQPLKNALIKLKMDEGEFKQDLENALKQEEQSIEELFKQLKLRTEKDAGTSEDLLDSFTRVEKGGYKDVELSLKMIEGSDQFLDLIDKMLPKGIDKTPFSGDIAKIEKLTTILIGAFNQGYKGIALVARTKLLKEHKKLLKIIRKEVQTAKISKEDAAVLKQQLADMALRIKAEEKEIKVQWSLLGITLTGAAVGVLDLPLTYLPAHLLPSAQTIALSKEILKGIGWAAKSLEVVVLAIDLKMKANANKAFDKWQSTFEKENIESIPRLEIKENGVPELLNKVLDVEEEKELDIELIRKKFFEKLDKVGDADRLKQLFELLHVELPEGSLEEIKQAALEGSPLGEELIHNYIIFRQTQQNLKLLSQTTKDLFTERQAAKEAKIFELMPLFHKIEKDVETSARHLFDSRTGSLVESLKKTDVEKIRLGEMIRTMDQWLNKKVIDKRSDLAKKLKEAKAFTKHPDAASQEKVKEFKQSLVSFLRSEREKAYKGGLDKKGDAAPLNFGLIHAIDSLIGAPNLSHSPATHEDGTLTSLGIVFTERVENLIKSGMLAKDSEIATKWKEWTTSEPKDKATTFAELQAAILKLEGSEDTFKEWYAGKSIEEKLALHIDRKATIDSAVKNSLKNLIGNKLTIEKKFLRFNLKSAALNYGPTAIAFTASVGFSILGLMGAPIAGAATVLLFIGLGSTLMSLALIGAGYGLAFKLRPGDTVAGFKGMPIKVLVNNIIFGLKRYKHNSRVKSLQKTASAIDVLIKQAKNEKGVQKNYEKLVEKFKKNSEEVKKSEEKLKKWETAVQALRRKSQQTAWEDFSKIVGFDSKEEGYLKMLAEGLEEMDAATISPELKRMLKVQLGFNPMSVKPGQTEDSIRKFFSKQDQQLVSFIRKQSARLERKLI